MHIAPHLSIPLAELKFSTSRSGGPGGQNVNKLETKVEVRFDVVNSPSLTNEQRSVILSRLKRRIDAEGILRVVVQESRSQWNNKQLAIDRLVELLRDGMKPKRIRKPTVPTKGAREERLQRKKRHSQKKRTREFRPGDE